jgi:hypothetical protein
MDAVWLLLSQEANGDPTNGRFSRVDGWAIAAFYDRGRYRLAVNGKNLTKVGARLADRRRDRCLLNDPVTTACS